MAIRRPPQDEEYHPIDPITGKPCFVEDDPRPVQTFTRRLCLGIVVTALGAGIAGYAFGAPTLSPQWIGLACAGIAIVVLGFAVGWK